MFDFRRSHTCGELNKSHINQKVTLSGWVHRRRDHGGLIFIDLRDKFGLTQLLFDPNTKEAHAKAHNLRSEWVISVTGTVIRRREGMANSNLSTGEIEIQVETLQILSQALTPPFSIAEATDANDELRLKYRYLDMRRGDLINKLQVRHKAMLATRNFLDVLGFMEISTPILAKSTPEGARDYLVPSRIYPGNFYALPQSPQIFKQLLMIGGCDRYFQIAPSFRDEDLRADRQPEFTQIDMEMSFATPDMLFDIVEDLFKKIFRESINVEILSPFPRITHAECIEHYGTDKPDLRFDMLLMRLDDIIEQSDFTVLKEVLSNGGCVKALCVEGGADLSRREIDELGEFVKKFGIGGLAWMKKSPDGFTSSIVKFFSPHLLHQIEERLHVKPNDLVLIAGQKEDRINQGLDHLRRYLAKKRNLILPNRYEFLWVTEFPLFKLDSETHEIESEHHPFTHPHFEDLSLLDENPTKVRSLAYDLVLNGYELGSGSQRIHDTNLQKKIFEILKLSQEDIHSKFGFFVDALKFGTPPHLGIGLGFDRINMILSNTENIRDVIAFPKTQKASDLMMKAPSGVAKEQLDTLKIRADYTEIPWP